MRRLWVRWVARDLRRRAVSLTAVALVVALGTGAFATLEATTAWRRESNARSFELLGFHDARLSLGRGVFVPAGTLRMALASMERVGKIAHVEERLVLRTQVDASDAAGTTVIVPGRIVAQGTTLDRLPVDGLALQSGRLPVGRGSPEVVLEYNFARHYRLPPSGDLTLAGGQRVRYSGQALHPEYFVVTGEEAGLLAESNFAVLFAPLVEGQLLAARPGEVNELVLRWAPGVDPRTAGQELERLVERRLPGVGARVTAGENEESFRILREDVKQDEELWSIISILILACAAFAVANLTARIVESQRREIGIGMALGMSPRLLALRPLAVGGAIGVLGVVTGLGVGVAGSLFVGDALHDLLPVPAWRSDFRFWLFAQAALVGLGLPLAAAGYPVWRGVRIAPIDVVRGARVYRRPSALLRIAQRVPLRLRPLTLMPFRNLARAPRRAVLTTLGIGAALTAMVGSVGMLDSMVFTVDVGDRELTRTAATRVRVEMDAFYPADGPELRAVTGHRLVRASETGLRLDATALAPGREIALLVQMQDLRSEVWAPTLTGRSGDRHSGIALSAKAARQLAVNVGDRVKIRHLRFTDRGTTVVTEEIPVIGVHAAPLRFLAYMPIEDAGRFGLAGRRNFAEIVPAAGSGGDDLVQAVFQIPGVATAQPVTVISRVFRNLLRTVEPIFRAVEMLVLVLAGIVALVSTRIVLEGRVRENATLLAAGLPVRHLVGLLSVEGLVVGLAGLGGGLAVGYAVVHRTVRDLLDKTLPEIDLTPHLASSTVLAAVVGGLLLVCVAPMLRARRVGSIDVPGTLRMVEEG